MVVKDMRRMWILQSAVCGLQLAMLWIGSQAAMGQITVMPLAESADPSLNDDLGQAQPPVVLSPVPDATIDPFAGYGYSPSPAGYGSGLVAASPDPLGLAVYDSSWHWQMFPLGAVYPTYLASEREPRMAAVFFNEREQGGLVDASVGGRFGLLRWGTDDLLKPEGFQIDIEAAAFPRLTLNNAREFVSTDFRAGVPFTFRRGPVEVKVAYSHYCSHLGDMYIEDHPGVVRMPYTRDSAVLGVALRPKEDFRLYAEADYAFYTYGNAQPWEFQFGIDWSTLQVTGWRGAPFLAMNGMIRQDVNYSGNLTVQVGWQWRGQSGQLLRTGFHYFNGKSNQGQFYDHFEEQIGMGLWYDF